MEYQNILWEQQDGVGVITLNRPNALNALNRPHLIELNHAFDRARFDPSVRSVVITGAGRGFSAGADVKEWGSGASEGDEPSASWIDLAHGLIMKIYRLPKPIQSWAPSARSLREPACRSRYALPNRTLREAAEQRRKAGRA